MKGVWLSGLAGSEQEIQIQLKKMKTYGLVSSAHLWADDNKGMAWVGVREELCKPQWALWAIIGTREAFLKPETRYGLAVLSLGIQARRGLGFPVVVLQSGTEAIIAADLPTPLQRAVVLSANDAGTPAKLVAKVHAKIPELASAYHVDMVGNQQAGQWFEVRPTRGEWQGMIFGVEEGEIKFQAVGPAGQLPATSTLNYPMQGLQIESGGRTYSAWAVRNAITPESSYYVKVEGFSKSLLFGAFSDENETELYHIVLK